MCGIFGSLGNADGKKVKEAFESLAHRGSDACFVSHEDALFLGQHRLAISDPTYQADDMYTQGDITLLFNGEIYNYLALKEELTEFEFTSKGDTQVVMAAFLKWGEDLVHHLEGMFAIAIYDKKKLLLYRDVVGKKPLYFLQTKGQFLFASSITALEPFSEKKRSLSALSSLLSFQTIMAPFSIYEDIHSLQAGECLRYENEAIERFFYADILPKEAPSIMTENHAIEAIENALHEAVIKRIPKEVDHAFLLSGGVDSSLLCAMAQRGRSTPIETFTLGYDEFERYDERLFAKEVAEHIGAENTVISFGFEDFKASIDPALEMLGQPLNDPAMLPLYFMFKSIKEQHGAKVVLSGEGSDELFFGYRPYLELLDMERLKGVVKKSWLKNYFKAHPSLHREWEWYRRIFNDEVLFQSSAQSWSDGAVKRLLRHSVKEYKGYDYIAHLRKRYEASPVQDDTVWYRYIDLKVDQGEYFLTKLDRMSMAHGIEARTPFLDQKLLQTNMSIDPSLFFHQQRTKHLIKEVAKEYLPQSIIDRKKKGFSYPYFEWMRRMGAFETMIEQNARCRLFKEKALVEALQHGKKGEFKQHIFGLFIMLRWCYNKEYGIVYPRK